ncbi:ferritin-like domain-containing protein [Polyangium aurulentum]|uniref:ferritin-like domain-containing protein n=1 Tax=Polyangium aurulentum TaxID=2567896 RepID=UPI0010AEB4DE|nr:ferritin-like domain-containing protein [Polyangium aurulentum]UQA54636.1 ferritin-like domain-containing protein [Polyangium aurulentum]
MSHPFSRRGQQNQEPVEQWLARIFERALRCSVLTGILAQGCTVDRPLSLAEETDPDAVDEREPTATPVAVDPEARGVSCPEGSYYPVSASGLNPSRDFDYIAIRQVYGDPSPAALPAERWTRSEFTVLSETGVACATATGAECREKVANHPASMRSPSCLQICSETSVVTTSGDNVRRWAGQQDLAKLLRPIDTPDEAILLVTQNYDVACNDAERGSVQAVEDGFLVTGTKMTAMCAPIIIMRYTLHVSRSGQVREIASEELERNENMCVGRIPEGLASRPRDRGASGLGDFLARCAHLEAASISAFERLAAELEAHGAPASLLAEARRAAEDEIRHADTVGSLARARGGEPVEARVCHGDLRSLDAVALENAVEGCVRETFGALLGAYQAAHAEDPEIGAAMRRIAEDEARHAALSWKVHAWAMERLGPEERERIRGAQADALAQLGEGQTRRQDPEIARAAGLPSPERSARLVDVLRQGLQARA